MSEKKLIPPYKRIAFAYTLLTMIKPNKFHAPNTFPQALGGGTREDPVPPPFPPSPQRCGRGCKPPHRPQTRNKTRGANPPVLPVRAVGAAAGGGELSRGNSTCPSGTGSIAIIGSRVLAGIFSQLQRMYRSVIPGVRRQRVPLIPRCFEGAVGTHKAEERYRRPHLLSLQP